MKKSINHFKVGDRVKVLSHAYSDNYIYGVVAENPYVTEKFVAIGNGGEIFSWEIEDIDYAEQNSTRD